MGDRPQKILLAEPDPDLLEILVGALSLRFDAHLTCVADVESCLDVEMTDPHDLVIAEMDLADQTPVDITGHPVGADCHPLLADFASGVVGRPRLVAGLDGLQLADQLASLGSRPIILLADKPTCRQAIAALRMGVRDLLPKPFPVEQLLDAAQRALEGVALRRRHLAKYHRMRALVRRVIRERRDLNQRIELICRDLVGAHRRLVHRVLDSPASREA